jgi:hypothetical protein
MSYVSDALAETAIVSLSPPIAFSAQLALKGRLGDDEALARSHWQRVESLLETQIIERCDALRERALRRKARRICAALGALAAARAHEEVARRDEARANSERRAALAASWRRDRVDLGRALIDELAAPLSRLAADALPIEQLSAERRTDPEVRSYLIDKSVARLTAPLCDALARRAGGTLIDDEALARVARAAIAGASAAVGGTRLAGDALLATIEALIASACDELEGHSDGPAQPSAHRARQIRLAALLRALESAAAI